MTIVIDPWVLWALLVGLVIYLLVALYFACAARVTGADAPFWQVYLYWLGWPFHLFVALLG